MRAKKIRHRTTLPHSDVQYHRRWAPYRSCSGWERELQARHRHRKKNVKDVKLLEKVSRQSREKVDLRISKDDLPFLTFTSWQI